MANVETLSGGGKPLVVVGSSAGGIEALSTFVARLPSDFAAPIVVAQHLDPARPSNLGAILDRRSTLPVVTVEGHTKLEVGTIYIAPANGHVTIHDGHVELEKEHRERPRPSIDLLLSTAAHAYGDRLFAVILTGSGSDGAAGAVTVKEAGGTIVVQNPLTARYPSMPMALPPTVIDHVVEIEQLASLLADLVRAGPLEKQVETQEDTELHAVLALVGRRSNIDFRSYKPTTILRRIARRMAITRIPTLHEYAQHLETNPAEIAELVMAFLIKVTEFMRDPEAFEYLSGDVLPRLIERGRLTGKELRFWSAGCATGEEPYSIAMILADLLGDELPGWSIKIFATDLDADAIAFARRGLYPANVLRELPHPYVARYFDALDSGLQISKSLRGMVIFGQQDLGRGVPFPRIDLVLCRNVLIYFKPELQQHVLDLFSYSLSRNGGYLFLGKAETSRPSNAVFEVLDKKWKFYRCTQSPLQTVHRTAALQQPTTLERASKIPGEDRPATTGDATPQGLRVDELVLRFLPFGTVVVDRAYRIVAINVAARRLLGIREPTKDNDFLHAVRGLPYARMRESIDSAFRDRATIHVGELEIDRESNDEARYLELSVVPMQHDGPLEFVAITVLDTTPEAQTRRRLEVVQNDQDALVRELGGANKRYAEVNKDLQDANEELQATNEEMVITQEELQATNEELEATNEELQATNEELETNNEELQATNEELEATNDELNIRTLEVQQMSRALVLQQRTQEELARTDKLKDEFLSLVSHELRTPMVTLSGYADMLRDALASTRDDAAAKAVEYVGRFRKQLDHLNRMIDDLFDVARAQTGSFSIEKAALDLVPLVRDTAADIARSLKNHQLLVTVGSDPILVDGDGGRLSQVVANLVQNAAAYAPKNPRIDVALERAKDENGRPIVVLSVRDHGAGIHPDALSSLFTRFYQVPRTPRPARAGLGLGLFICRQIVEQHGGTITAESKLGQGTTFIVRLPTLD